MSNVRSVVGAVVEVACIMLWLGSAASIVVIGALCRRDPTLLEWFGFSAAIFAVCASMAIEEMIRTERKR